MQQAKNSTAPPKKKLFGKKNEPAMSGEHQELIDEYFATLSHLRSLQEFFERITDPDLISVCVYEINATQRRYAYLLAQLKEKEVTYLKVLR